MTGGKQARSNTGQSQSNGGPRPQQSQANSGPRSQSSGQSQSNSGPRSQSSGQNQSNYGPRPQSSGQNGRQSSGAYRGQYNTRSQGEGHPNQERDLAYKHNLEGEWRSNPRENSQNIVLNYRNVKLDCVLNAAVVKQLQLSQQNRAATTQVTLQHVIQSSKRLWDNFPSNTARMHVLQEAGVSQSKLEEHINSVYPIVHHTTLNLMVDFLDHKRRHGTNIERTVYEGMDLLSFVDRLLKKRPLSFLGSNDHHLLENLTEGYGGFDVIGTDQERSPKVLKALISYDEMRIAALISLSSWSVFVNDGTRKNYGKKDKAGTFQPDGVIVGQVGARLKKSGVMDYLDCVATRQQNVPENGFGGGSASHINSVWGSYWGGRLPTYREANDGFLAQRDGKANCDQFEYMQIGRDILFNVTVYKQRIAITAEVLLCEANLRAELAGKKAYVHVVGLGLGVWRATDKQDNLFVEAWGDALCNITNTEHIAHVDFSYIDSKAVHGIKTWETFPGTNITIHFSTRNLHSKVPEDCILVCNYAWDGNSLPGNEFWLSKMCSTGDSAAACSSTVAEVHNHLINPRVGADALMVATKGGRALHWTKYLQLITSGGSSGPLAAVPPVHRTPSTPVQQSGVATPTTGTHEHPQSGGTRTPTPTTTKHTQVVWGNSNTTQMVSATVTAENVTATVTAENVTAAVTAENVTTTVTAKDVIVAVRVQQTSAETEEVQECDVSKVQASKKAKHHDGAEPSQEGVADVSKKDESVPEMIRHDNIPGLMIPNPAFIKLKKGGAKKPRPENSAGKDGSVSKKAANKGSSKAAGEGKSNTNSSSGKGKNSTEGKQQKGAGKSNNSNKNKNKNK